MGKVGCKYEFEWATNAVCSEDDRFDLSECSFYDSRLGFTHVFHSLRSDTNYEVRSSQTSSLRSSCLSMRSVLQVKGSQTNENYFANICHSTRGCKTGSSVCTSDQTSFGSAQDARFLREDEDHIKLVFGDGDPCTGTTRNRSASILFTCDETDLTGDTKPELLNAEVWRLSFLLNYQTKFLNTLAIFRSQICVTCQWNGKRSSRAHPS